MPACACPGLLQNNVVINCCATFLVHRDRVRRNPRVMYELLFNLSYPTGTVSGFRPLLPPRCTGRLVQLLQNQHMIPVYNGIAIGYVMEISWHRIFGEPWMLPKQNLSAMYPHGGPNTTPWPLPSSSASPSPPAVAGHA